jgi:hypothetical protein
MASPDPHSAGDARLVFMCNLLDRAIQGLARMEAVRNNKEYWENCFPRLSEVVNQSLTEFESWQNTFSPHEGQDASLIKRMI